ncbi:hypothetical protein TCSYLVIO_010567 [Trypanosoma cruzi]|nr:hypothetical protein TCSYLVIO_010567 [Trypanosoma cruzi]
MEKRNNNNNTNNPPRKENSPKRNTHKKKRKMNLIKPSYGIIGDDRPKVGHTLQDELHASISSTLFMVHGMNFLLWLPLPVMRGVMTQRDCGIPLQQCAPHGLPPVVHHLSACFPGCVRDCGAVDDDPSAECRHHFIPHHLKNVAITVIIIVGNIASRGLVLIEPMHQSLLLLLDQLVVRHRSVPLRRCCSSAWKHVFTFPSLHPSSFFPPFDCPFVPNPRFQQRSVPPQHAVTCQIRRFVYTFASTIKTGRKKKRKRGKRCIKRIRSPSIILPARPPSPSPWLCVWFRACL